MKKTILILIMVDFLVGCGSKVISQEYYEAHITEANDEVVKCFKNKDENSLNCENAKNAISRQSAKEQKKQISNNL